MIIKLRLSHLSFSGPSQDPYRDCDPLPRGRKLSKVSQQLQSALPVRIWLCVIGQSLPML